jgi:hypothetical protein
VALDKLEQIVVNVDDQHGSSIDTIAAALRGAGMEIDGVMPTIRVITGKVASSTVQGLREIPGVLSVEPDQEMRAI